MFFRKRNVVRGLACFFLLETVATLAAPGVSWAMMGPGQPEFTSYEASGSPDLVNLTTGDFTYNIPVIEVPGPERGFSMPLTYRAGIKLEQEASWVGLGWSLNAGAIARSLTGYPDDAAGELMQSTYQQKITRGWTGGIPGVLELGWDVNTGHSGSASLIGLVGLGWSGGGISSGNLVGVHASKDGVTINAVEVATSALTIATLGTAGSLSAVAGAAASQLGSDAATGIVASALLGRASSGGGALGEPSVKEEKGFLHTNYWVYYNDQKSESMYGSLYFGLMSQRTKPMAADNPSPLVYQGSTSNPGAKSPEFSAYASSLEQGRFYNSPGADLYLYNAPGTTYWETNKNPISIAHDDFSVMGGNVSGNIRPYRLEVGSLAFPYEGLNDHRKFAAISYLTDYKVPFRYENSVANSYDYHLFTPSSTTTTDGLGIDGYMQPNYSSNWTGGIILKDPSLYGNGTRTAPARKGILNQPGSRQLVQGKNVKWFSNQDILTQYASSTDGDGSMLEVNYPTSGQIADPPEITGYTPCADQTDPYCQATPIYGDPTSTTSNNPWRVTLPGKGIGAFAVTAEDGTTYHYSLPVYHYTQYSKSHQLVKPADAEEPGVSTQTIGPRSWHATGGGYATTWLLTAITSSDYVDRGKLGTVDDTDWGGWVRFDYGKFSSTYKWRQPYVGENAGEDTFNDASFSEGYKETYYLNSIRTRSHTALFLKSVRNDARGHYQSQASNLGINEAKPASSLRLDEVVLLTNADLAKLQTPDGIRTELDGGPAIPAFTPNTAGNNAQFDAAELQAGDTYQYVLDQHDADSDPRIRAFLNQRTLKRVVFNYSYRLCASTPNSFPSVSSPPTFEESQFSCTRTGKLTLESVSTYGPAATKLLPDFKFQYDFNPDYQKDSWDGFGMYKSGVTVNAGAGKPTDYHQVSTDFAVATQDASAWSLTGITSPEGGQTRVKYERDQYSKVSEYNLGNYSLSNADCSNVFTASGLPTGTTLSDFVKAGDVVLGNSVFNYYYACQFYGDCGHSTNESCPDDKTCSSSTAVPAPIHILSVSGNTLTIAPQDVLPANCPPPPSDTNPSYTCSNLQAQGASLFIPNLAVTKNGGDLRVAVLSTLDEAGHEYQVRYTYAMDERPAASSSGVISKEPAFVTREKRPFDGWFDYPGTSVMYGKVGVLRGLFRSGAASDYTQREEYTFQTPVSSMVQTKYGYSGGQIAQGDQGTQYSTGWRQLDKHTNVTTISLGAIGQPLGIRKLNRRGEVESSTTFGYSNNLPNPDGIAKQGTFTEGVMTNELLGGSLYFYRINRSTKVYQPTVMVSSTTTTNGIATQSQQEKFDFYTGQVVESSFRNFLGDVYRSKIVPAYTLANYTAMGPASENSTNRNMLTQQAASYVYKVRADGSKSVVSAGVQTWNDNWATYHNYNAGSDTYRDQADDPRPIWRLCQSYIWVSSRLNADGTYADADFTDFDWSRTPLTNQVASWVKAGEFTRYDHYSKPLESQDINGQYVTRKLGYDQTQRLVTAANARYTEVAYSGAEDLFALGNSTAHFGGEVRNGDRRSALQHHTGLYSTKLAPAQQGFTYQAAIGSEVRGGRTYRLSCWVHRDAAAGQAQLYAQLDGVDQLGPATIASANTKQAGDWYLLNLLVTVPTTGQQLTVGCRHAGSPGVGDIYVDDFRFNPVDGPSTAYVYDAYTSQLTYVLDNDNLFTHYEYDAAGKVMRISKEVLTPAGSSQIAERRVKEYEYNFAQMPTPNWLPTGVVAWGPGPAGQVRPRQREERDINPRSTTFNATHLVADGSSKSCVSDCPPAGTVLATGLCDSKTDQAGNVTYFHFNYIADGRCASYRDEYDLSQTPLPDCNP